MAKLKIIVPLLLVLAVGYKFVLAKPATAEPKPKVEGTLYVLGKEFLVNLAGGRYAKLTVALVVKEGDKSIEAAGGEGASPPDGYGNMAQEAIVRSDITDVLTDTKDSDLINAEGRHKVQEAILRRIKRTTDVQVEEVLFPDVTVQ